MLTNGKSDTERMPLRADSDASLSTLISSSISKSLIVSNVKSSMDTFNVGTLVAMPFNLPLSSGITSPMAFAAPVLEGIIDEEAALALYKSE